MKHREQLVVWMVWFAMLTSIHIYVVLLKTGDARPQPAADASSMVTVLSLAAVAAAAASLVLRAVLLGGFKKGTLSLDSPEGRQRYVAGNVVCFALSEMPGVFGFVTGLQGFPTRDWAAFIGASALLFWWHIPLPGRFTPKTDGRLL